MEPQSESAVPGRRGSLAAVVVLIIIAAAAIFTASSAQLDCVRVEISDVYYSNFNDIPI